MPEDPEEVAKLKALQREIHAIFIALVKQGRSGRLKGDESKLFSGEYWAGETSVQMGLADGIGDHALGAKGALRRQGLDAGHRAADRIAVRPVGTQRVPVRSVVVLHYRDCRKRLVSALETRAIWARYGF